HCVRSSSDDRVCHRQNYGAFLGHDGCSYPKVLRSRNGKARCADYRARAQGRRIAATTEHRWRHQVTIWRRCRSASTFWKQGRLLCSAYSKKWPTTSRCRTSQPAILRQQQQAASATPAGSSFEMAKDEIALMAAAVATNVKAYVERALQPLLARVDELERRLQSAEAKKRESGDA